MSNVGIETSKFPLPFLTIRSPKTIPKEDLSAFCPSRPALAQDKGCTQSRGSRCIQIASVEPHENPESIPLPREGTD